MHDDDGPGSHRQYENMAVAHVLGGLGSDEGRVFRSHLLECPVCRARVGELRAIASELAGVERDERRQRSARAVETKRRQEAQADDDREVARSWAPSRWLLLGLVVLLVALGTYTIVLRGNYQRQVAVSEERLREAAALEHGEELESRYVAPDVVATAKVHRERVVVLLEGLADDTSYGLYLVDDSQGTMQTVGSRFARADGGRMLVLLPAPPSVDRVIVTAPAGAEPTDPDGERILEAVVHQPAAQPASIGSG